MPRSGRPWAGRPPDRTPSHRHRAARAELAWRGMAASVLAFAALPVAFAVADATGVRPLGGAVLVVLAGGAVLVARAPVWRAAAWVAVLLTCFVGSHVLADPLGTW